MVLTHDFIHVDNSISKYTKLDDYTYRKNPNDCNLMKT